VSYDARILFPTLVLGSGCLAASIVIAMRRQHARALEAAFGVMGIGAAAAAVGWLAAAT
jgi:hypothetical protein